VLGTPAFAQDKSIVVASTTSTQDSGLFEYLLPLFTKKTGIAVKVVAQGTGQALDTGRRGDADVVFVHAKAQEEKFLAEGQGVKRFPVMYNDFVLIGPKSDPAGIRGVKDVAKAFQTIKDKQAPFISRGDRSGTHTAELKLWKDASIDIERDKGPWYKSIGQGMGAALNTAGASNAYVLSDRGTWIHFKNKGESAETSQRQERAWPDIHRLADLPRRTKGDCQLQDQRRTTVLPECRRSECVMPTRVGRIQTGSRSRCIGGSHALRARLLQRLQRCRGLCMQ
jgi:ABC-type tungstate transport system permease subunit